MEVHDSFGTARTGREIPRNGESKVLRSGGVQRVEEGRKQLEVARMVGERRADCKDWWRSSVGKPSF